MPINSRGLAAVLADTTSVNTSEGDFRDGLGDALFQIDENERLLTLVRDAGTSGATVASADLTKLSNITATASQINALNRTMALSSDDIDTLQELSGSTDAAGYLQNDGSGNYAWDAITVSDVTDLTASAAELNTLDGFLGNTADLNYAATLQGTGVTEAEFEILDGLTATTAELNTLDGFTGDVADLNYAATLQATGVTQAEFDRLDGLTSSTAELNTLDGFTGNATDLNYAATLQGTGVTEAEFDRLDGLTPTTAELNRLDLAASTQLGIFLLEAESAGDPVIGDFTGNVTLIGQF